MMVGNTISHDTRVLKSALALADGGLQVTLLGASPTRTRQETRWGDVHVIRVPVTYRLRDRRLRRVVRRSERHLDFSLPPEALDAVELRVKQRVRERDDLGGRDRELRARWALLQRRLARLRNEADERIADVETSLLEAATEWWDGQEIGVSWRRDLPEVDDLDLAFTPVVDAVDWDVLHAHDIHHVGTAARAVARRRAAGRDALWVYDAHEYVRGLSVYPPRTKRLIAAWADLENEFVRDADAVVTVTAPLAEQLREDHRLPTTPTVVMNAPVFSAELDTSGPGVRQTCGLPADAPLVVYSGGVTRARGVHTVVEALPQMPGVHLAVVCVPHNHTIPARELGDLAERLGVDDRVHILDPVPPESVSSFLAEADLGLLPIAHFGSHEFALSNKLFEYLHAGLPLVVSDCRAQAEFVTEKGVGTVFPAEDPAACAGAVLDALGRREALHRRIVEDPDLLAPYSWEHQAARLRDLCRRLLPTAAITEPPHETPLADVPTTPAWRDDRASMVGIGPSDTAGQGWAWAKAVERAVPGVCTYVLRTHRGGPLRYPADETVSLDRFNEGGRWSTAMFERISASWTHALIEAGRPMMGGLFGKDFVGDVDVLRGLGIRVGLVFHGSEIRDPRAHAARTPFSPFADPDDELTARLTRQRLRLHNRLLTYVENDLGPVFVSTPDLLADVPPGAVWLPIVVDTGLWAAEPTAFDREVPVVLHAPTNSALKGSTVADEVARRLEREGLIRYDRVSGIPPEQMPDRMRAADIVLDQFALGMHGVAAVEAMAAGRIVLAHITDENRALLSDCPVVEANPDTLEDVLRGLLADREAGRRAARAGQEYAREVHDGRRSAAVLAEHLHLHG